MAKTAVLNIRLEPSVKATAEQLYSSLGLSLSDAVNLFLRQSIIDDGMPFRPHQLRYSPETEAAMQETREVLSGARTVPVYSSASQLFAALDAEEDDT
jgi:DNA-damage-inducible protein J